MILKKQGQEGSLRILPSHAILHAASYKRPRREHLPNTLRKGRVNNCTTKDSVL